MKNKLLLIIFLIITILSTAQPIFAAVETSGTQKWVAGQYDSKMRTTDSKTDVGIIIRRLVNYNSGEKITTFCAEHNVNSPTGSIEIGTHTIPSDSLIKKACKIAYFGWYSRYGDYAIDGGILAADMIWVREHYVFSQQYIWEVLGQSNATFIDADVQNRYLIFKAEVEQKIANAEKRPSFVNETISIDVGKSITLIDANEVLKDYAGIDKTVNGIRIVHNYGENTINVSIDSNCNLETYNFTEEDMENYGLIKEETKNHDTTVYIMFKEGVQNQVYAMNYNDPVSMSLNLQINSFGSLELSKLNTQGKLIDGAIFKVQGPNDFSKEVKVTGGKITLDKLKKGIYTIQEKSAPNGYLIDNKTYKVEVFPNQKTTQTIINNEPTGTFTLVKKNADKTATIEGTKYRIWNNDGYDKEFTTNKEGKITVTGLKLGTYNYKETQAANGYIVDTNTYSFELKYKDQNTSVVYANTEKTNEEPVGKIFIIKKDSETRERPQGDATFFNAKYEVYAEEDIYNKAKTKKFYSKEDLVATRNINEGGTTEVVENLPLGKYKVKEIVSSEGYLIDSKEYQINLEYQNQNTKVISKTVTSYEKVKKMQVHIFKSGVKENSGLVAGLEGAEFTIKLNSDIKKAYSQGYSYAEIWNGIDENGNKVSVDNKRVAEAQKIAPTYEKIITDKDGNGYTKKLPYGTYTVKETVTPKGFESAADFTFSITQDESEVKEIAQKVKHLVVNNEQLESYIKIIKKDSKTDKTVTLSSSTFEIKATEDIYDKGTGKIIYKKGEIIKQKVGSTTYSKFTTNADNIVVPKGSYNNTNDEKGTVTIPLLLPVGSYEITEIKAPNGFLLLEQPVAFKIEGIKDSTTEIIIKNEQPTGILIIDKSVVLSKNVDTSLIDISDLSKIQFKLMAKEDIIDFADGSIIYEKGKQINIYNLDKNGHLKIENLPMGVYEIQEIKTLDGLILNDTKYEVKFTTKDQVTKVYEQKKEIENKTTIVEFSKQDITNEKGLIGAKLTLINENNEVIDTWISTEKNHIIEGLISGKKYILKEEMAPDGYMKTDNIEFTVNTDKGMQLIVMKDMPILKNIKVVKLDSNTKEPIKSKFKFAIYEDSECTKLIEEVESNVEQGTVEFKDLKYGIYYIKETEAPRGYYLSTKIIKIDINKNGVFADEKKLVEKDEVYSLDFYDTLIPTIQTGINLNNGLLLTLMGSSVIGILLGIIILKRVF